MADLCIAFVGVSEPIDVIGASDVSSDDSSLDGAYDDDDRLVPYTSKMVLVDTL